MSLSFWSIIGLTILVEGWLLMIFIPGSRPPSQRDGDKEGR